MRMSKKERELRKRIEEELLGLGLDPDSGTEAMEELLGIFEDDDVESYSLGGVRVNSKPGCAAEDVSVSLGGTIYRRGENSFGEPTIFNNDLELAHSLGWDDLTREKQIEILEKENADGQNITA